jgi:hypothetical protein
MSLWSTYTWAALLVAPSRVRWRHGHRQGQVGRLPVADNHLLRIGQSQGATVVDLVGAPHIDGHQG